MREAESSDSSSQDKYFIDDLSGMCITHSLRQYEKTLQQDPVLPKPQESFFAITEEE